MRIPGTTGELIKYMLEKRLGPDKPHLPASTQHDEAARNHYAYECGAWDTWIGLQQAWEDQQEQTSHGSVQRPA